MQCWRICRKRYAAEAASGEGARLYGGRWNSRGVRVVYASTSLALAAVETFVNLEPMLRPADLVSIQGDIPDAFQIRTLDVKMLPARWHATRNEALHRFGDEWVRQGADGGAAGALGGDPGRMERAVETGSRGFLRNPVSGSGAFRIRRAHVPLDATQLLRQSASPRVRARTGRASTAWLTRCEAEGRRESQPRNRSDRYTPWLYAAPLGRAYISAASCHHVFHEWNG